MIYGRAAIALGFSNPPQTVHETLDVDAIIQLSQLDELVHDDGFWDAKDAVNEKFEDEGLYITHLFQENQVFLRETWEQDIVPIGRPQTRYLKLSRPATVDLILTKMMRGDDEQDMKDVAFLAQHDCITSKQIEAAFQSARLPDIPELHDAFTNAKPVVRQIVANLA